MNASEAEKKVRERWPDAIARLFRWPSTGRSVHWIERSRNGEVIGRSANDEGAAWLDAAQRMEEEHDEH